MWETFSLSLSSSSNYQSLFPFNQPARVPALFQRNDLVDQLAANCRLGRGGGERKNEWLFFSSWAFITEKRTPLSERSKGGGTVTEYTIKHSLLFFLTRRCRLAEGKGERCSAFHHPISIEGEREDWQRAVDEIASYSCVRRKGEKKGGGKKGRERTDPFRNPLYPARLVQPSAVKEGVVAGRRRQGGPSMWWSYSRGCDRAAWKKQSLRRRERNYLFSADESTI